VVREKHTAPSGNLIWLISKGPRKDLSLGI
jgi:hypothetical protein